MSSRANSKLYTCGRMHKPRKHKLPLHVQSARTNAVISAVTRLMKEELGEVACTRWCSRLNTELGCETFGCEPRVEEGGSSGDGEGEADGWLAGAALPVALCARGYMRAGRVGAVAHGHKCLRVILDHRFHAAAVSRGRGKLELSTAAAIAL